jgi:hypothetical protein
MEYYVAIFFHTHELLCVLYLHRIIIWRSAGTATPRPTTWTLRRARCQRLLLRPSPLINKLGPSHALLLSCLHHAHHGSARASAARYRCLRASSPSTPGSSSGEYAQRRSPLCCRTPRRKPHAAIDLPRLELESRRCCRCCRRWSASARPAGQQPRWSLWRPQGWAAGGGRGGHSVKKVRASRRSRRWACAGGFRGGRWRGTFRGRVGWWWGRRRPPG